MDLVTLGMSVRAVRAETREADFIASTDAIDSYGESVKQNWRLERYASNPVVLYAHNSRELPIGKSLRTAVKNGALECTIKFATADANPEAEKVWKLVQQDILRAVSVGFYPHTVTRELRDDVEVYVLDDNELMEISVVPIPANPEALAKMRARAIANATPKTETTDMDIKQLEEKANAAETRAVAAEKSLADLTEKHAQLETEHGKIVEALGEASRALDTANVELTALRATEKDAQDKLIEKTVNDLVGVKLLPAEKDEWLELAKSDMVRFEKLMAKRPELKILGASPITTEKTPNENTAAADPNGDDLAIVAAKEADKLALED